MQVVYVFTATNGYLDDLPVEDARRFVEEVGGYVEVRYPGVLEALRGGTFPDETEAELRAAIEEFKATFAPSGGTSDTDAALAAGTPPDEVRPDVGWDRMSSADDGDARDDGAPPPAADREAQRTEAGSPPPGPPG
jgi:hypothetical protein